MIDPATQLPTGTTTILRAEVGSTVHSRNKVARRERDATIPGSVHE